MKKIIKFIAIVLSLVVCFNIAACAKDEGYAPVYKRPGAQAKDVTYTNNVLVENGNSAYKIVMPTNATTRETLAVSEFNELFKLSVGKSLDIVTDDTVDYSATAKFVSIGQTDFLSELNIVADYSQLGDQGYVIKNAGASIVIVGADRNGYGTLYGVYDFLAQQIGFECYAEDETYVEEIKNVNLVSMDVADKPDIPNQVLCGGVYENNTTFRIRNRFVANTELFTDDMSMYHSSFVFLNPDDYFSEHPDWYADISETNGQICYTAHGNEVEYAAMVEQLFQNFLAIINNDADNSIKHIGFCIMDNLYFCECQACAAMVGKYGANSATVIRFMNDLSDKFTAYYADLGTTRELYFMFFAYKTTYEPPTKNLEEIKCRDNVYPFICTFNMNRTASFTDEKNSAGKEAVDNWSKVAKYMSFWTYSANYDNFTFPYDNISCLQENLQYVVTKNPLFYKDEGPGKVYNPSGFNKLKYWLNYKLCWDVNDDVPSLINEYFEHYFQDAAEPMYEFFTLYRLAVQREFTLNGYDHYDTAYLDPKSFSYGELLQWKNLIEQAKESIAYLKVQDSALYEKLYARIVLESINVNCTILYAYSSEYTDSEIAAMKESLKADCALTKCNVFKDSSSALMTDYIDSL